MTPTEAVKLCRFIAARCPAMRMQDETPEAWYLDLVGYDLSDAMEAARTTTLDKAFISLGDLVTECRNIVRRREGREKEAARQAQIAAENGGDADLNPVTAGPPAAAVMRAIEAPLHDRVAIYREGRDRARREREEREAAKARDKAERSAAVAAARAELAARLPVEAPK